MTNQFPSLHEAIPMLFYCGTAGGRRELTDLEVSACAAWMEDHRPVLSQTLQELACLMQLLDRPQRLSLVTLADRMEDLLATTYGNLLEQDELLHETGPEAWAWPAWSERHAGALLRLLVLSMLQLELGWPRVTRKLYSSFPWPEDLQGLRKGRP